MLLRPFFSYYGSKWRAAPKYPAPQHELLIEPFAGSAGFSTRHYTKKVILYDIDPVIADIWNYLIRVPEREILALPDIAMDGSVDDYQLIPEAKHLIGFWLNKGGAHPGRRPSAWMRRDARGLYENGTTGHYWGACAKQRIATQLPYIRHWQCHNTSYDNAPDVPAYWFVDPPYQKWGKRYRCKELDRVALRRWLDTRVGQVLLCEQEGADWHPFNHSVDLQIARNTQRSGTSRELYYYRE